MTYTNLQCTWICQGPSSRMKESQLRRHCPDVQKLTGTGQLPVHRAQRDPRTGRLEKAQDLLECPEPVGLRWRDPGNKKQLPETPILVTKSSALGRPGGLRPRVPLYLVGVPCLFIRENPGWQSAWAQLGRKLGTAGTISPMAPTLPVILPACGHLHWPH